MTSELEILLRDVPKDVLYKPCTDKDDGCRELLLSVSQDSTITPATLGRWLHLEESDVQSIEQDNPRMSSCERKYLMLLKWTQCKGRNATHQVLLEALYKARDVATVERVITTLGYAVALTRHLECAETSITVKEPDVRTMTTIGTPITEHAYSSQSSDLSTTLEYIEDICVTPRQPSSACITPMESVTSSKKTMLPPGCPGRAGTHSPSRSPFLGLFPDHRPDSLPMLHQQNVTSRNACSFGHSTGAASSPFTSVPKCANAMGQMIQCKMNQIIIQYKEASWASWLKYVQTQEKLEHVMEENEFQRVELSKSNSKMRTVVQQANQIHSENFQLRQELELNQELLALLCGTLEVWKENVNEEILVCPLRSQIDSLLQSVRSNSSSVPESLISIERDYQKLKKERDELEQELNNFCSLYAEKLTQLKVIAEENSRLERNSQSKETEVLELKLKVKELLGRCEKMSQTNKKLEEKVAVLEKEKQELATQCSELKKNRVVVVLSKPAQTEMSINGILRSCSEGTYVEQRHPFFKTGSEDLNDNNKKCKNLNERVIEGDYTSDSISLSLEWVESVNEMITKCDDGSVSVVRSVHDLQRRLNEYRVNQKLQQYI